MSFRIDRSRNGVAPRVYHESDDKLAVALILGEDDGTVTLFPVRFTEVPLPLTGASMSFPTEADALSYLGISDLAEAA
jgi:hypothetical protein